MRKLYTLLVLFLLLFICGCAEKQTISGESGVSAIKPSILKKSRLLRSIINTILTYILRLRCVCFYGKTLTL